MPRFGEGARLRRVTWRAPKGEADCFWTVDSVKPRAVRCNASRSRYASRRRARAAVQP
jgi:hypothetical protein